jgi:hypothetical protein
MLNPTTESQLRPPALIPSLVKGFNAIAANVYIILIPVALDVFLWFGPMLRVRNLLLPGMLRALELSSAAYGEESGMLAESARQLWTLMLEGFNLLFGLRTYPIGVPSLMVSQGAASNPLGGLRIFEMLSLNSSALVILLVSLAGVLLGSLYFSLIAAVAAEAQEKPALPAILRRGLHSILLSIILLVTILAIGLPLMCLLSGIVLFLPALGALPFTLFGILMVWVLLPLAFSPHGIFTDQLRATRSIVMSVKLVRSLMAASGMFLIIAILLSYGMDILWSTPTPDSWVMLVGIIGHAFISSGLLAASFVFYHDGIRWLSERMHSQPASVKQADG